MWDDARAYDLATGSFADDLPYWQSLVAEYRPRRILDLGCGTGRLTLTLLAAAVAARDDAEVVGLDASTPFLRGAREKLATTAHADRVCLVEGDMRDFDLGEPFDLVVCGFNTLSYVHGIDDHLACVAAIRRNLAVGGRFAFDVQTPSLPRLGEELRAVFPAVRREYDWANPANGVARFSAFYVTSHYNRLTQTEFTTHYWEIYYEDGRRESLVKETAWHQYYPDELRLLLRQAGLRPVAEYGGYDRAPFGEHSPMYLWVTAAT
jgi:SAM-dependent methyltransferase